MNDFACRKQKTFATNINNLYVILKELYVPKPKSVKSASFLQQGNDVIIIC